MPARPWYPHNVGDYDRKTKLLTLEQHGAYRALLDYAWDHDGLIPKTDRERGQIWKVHTNRAHVLWKTLGGFWYETPGGFRNKRVDKELRQAAESYEKRAAAGRKGGLSNAQAMLKHPTSTTTEEKRKTPSESKEKTRSTRGTRLPSDWTPPPEFLTWARQHGNGLDVALEAEKFRDYWIAQPGQRGVKVSWLATWRNWVRNAVDRQHSVPNGQRRGVQPGERGSLYTKPIPGVDT